MKTCRDYFCAFCLCAITCFSGSAVADTLQVPADYPTIQAAIDASVNGDEVVLADGVYTGPQNRALDFAGREITLRSHSGDPTLCKIDCEGLARGLIFDDGETPDSRVEGITIENGYSNYEGGGIYVFESSPTIFQCVFRDGGTIFWGGGIYNLNGSPRVLDCLFVDGEGGFGGGGIHNEGGSAVIGGCDFLNNTSPDAGGGAISSFFGDVIVRGCRFRGNTTTASTDFGGGAILIFGGNAVIENCDFRNNMSDAAGGAIANVGADSVLVLNSLFLSNVSLSISNPRGGGAIYNQSSEVDIRSCTLGRNHSAKDAGGVYNLLCSPDINNSILWANTDAFNGVESAQIFTDTGAPHVSYCCIQGLDTFAGNGNIGNRPKFADASGRLAPSSPCKDTGDPAYILLPGERDLDRENRIVCGRIDMGAYESNSCP